MFAHVLVTVITFVIVFIHTRRRKRTSNILQTLLKRFGDSRTDYGVVPRGGLSLHPEVHWDSIRNVIARIQSSSDELVDLRLTDTNILRPLGFRVPHEEILLRFQSPSYHAGLHYDCGNQEVTQVMGQKRWLLFDLDFDSSEEELAFAKRWWPYERFDALQSALEKMNVSYDVVTTSPGDILRIPMGRWHQTEGVPEQGMSVIYNRELGGNDPVERARRMKRFDRMFPKQAQACHENDCRY